MLLVPFIALRIKIVLSLVSTRTCSKQSVPVLVANRRARIVLLSAAVVSSTIVHTVLVSV